MKTTIRTTTCMFLAGLLCTASAQEKLDREPAAVEQPIEVDQGPLEVEKGPAVIELEPLQVEKPHAVEGLPLNKPPLTRASLLTDLEITEEAIESILKNKDAATTLEKLKAATSIDSIEDAAKYLNRASIEALKDKVDFSKDKLLLFVWKGSTTDNFYVSPRISRPPSAIFTHNPGQEKEMKTHVKIFALQKDAEWSVSSNEVVRFKIGNNEEGEIEVNVEGPLELKVDIHVEINEQPVPAKPQAPEEQPITMN